MNAGPLQSYLREMKRSLWRRGLADQRTLEEIEGHLLDAVEAGIQQGLGREAAERQAVERFGSSRLIAAQFDRERNGRMYKAVLFFAVAVGLFAAYVDAQPKWDDMGILAMGLFMASGLLALLGGRRPWLIALVVGVWIPLHDIIVSHNFGALIALVFTFVGAYAGWIANRVVVKTLHPA